MKIVHIITGLGNGGAEGFLFRLCKNQSENENIIISLKDKGKYGPLLEDIGIKVFCLNISWNPISLFGLIKLLFIIVRSKPDLVQTWMYHANLIGGLASKLLGYKKVFWNIRHSNFIFRNTKITTILVVKICAMLSKFIPIKIIYCAHEAQRVHINFGFSALKSEVIHNGYELTDFKMDNNLRNLLRKEFNIDQNEIVIGMVGRYHPQKDHLNLINALALLKNHGYSFKVLLVGNGMEINNLKINEYLKIKNLYKETLLIGPRSDMPKIMNSLDIHVLSSSYGEGFSNVIAESMACGIPNISTDIGDSSLIISNTGWIVPPKNYELLEEKLICAINEITKNPDKWYKRKNLCREKITKNFNINVISKFYNQLWKNN